MFAPNTKNVYYLVDVKYLEDKKQIVLFFVNQENKIIQRHVFFPSLLLPKSIALSDLKKFLSVLDLRKFKIIVFDNSIKLVASNYSNLKKAFNLITASFNVQPLLLEPERQFLLEKNFSYFNSFKLILNTLIKSTELPSEEFLEFYLNNMHVSKEDNAFYDMLENIVLSMLLRMPLNKIPESKHLHSLFFTENLLFASQLSFNNSFKSSSRKLNFSLIESFKKKTIIDLNLHFLWLHLIESKNFFRLNCDCCTTNSLYAPNTLKSSKVEVLFKENAYYFLPVNDFFALKFHQENTGKNSRINLMNDFSLQKLPVGPFFENQKLFIELSDAVNLYNEERVLLTGNQILEWYCIKQQNLLMKQLSSLNLFLSNLKEFYNCFYCNSLSFEKTTSKSFLEYFISYLEFFLSKVDLTVAFNEMQFNAFKAEQFHYIDKIKDALMSSDAVILFYDEKRFIFASDNAFDSLKAINSAINFDLNSSAKFVNAKQLKEIITI